MLFGDHLVVMRGGGDLATGVAHRLNRAGFPLVVLELEVPLTVRRTVAVSTAVTDGEIVIDGLVARRVDSAAEALLVASGGVVAVMVSEDVPEFGARIDVLVDARMLKESGVSTLDDAGLVVALGPGPRAGVDCDAVIETMRGHDLGRVLWEGEAAPNRGVPGRLGGQDELRVLRAETGGPVEWVVGIGEHVVREQVIGTVGDVPVRALTSGVVRGLIVPGFVAVPGLKLGDVDPRADRASCHSVSDKALAVGGGVLEAVLTHLNRTA